MPAFAIKPDLPKPVVIKSRNIFSSHFEARLRRRRFRL